MASWDHEGIIELFRNDPRLAPGLLMGPLGISVPAFSEARIESGTMIDHHPPEIRADLVVTLRADTCPVLGIVLESQREEDPDKLYSWPSYVTWLRRSLRADACVLVVTQSERVARWAAQPIPLGPGDSFLQPLVLGPGSVPVITDVGIARRAPELAVLSAMVHGGGHVETAVEVALVAATAAHALDRNRFLLYFGLVQAALSEAARKLFQMNPLGVQFYDESQQKSFDRGRDEGRAEEKAAAILAVLETRGLSPGGEERERIETCTDFATLDRWLRRAVTVASIRDLFG